MSRTFDAIILGLGGMGSAAAFHLAARGQRVLGFDQFAPPHEQGSTHGRSRVIRQAYYEDPAYVPLLLRAYELWRELEHQAMRQLLTVTGGLMLGVPDSGVVAGSLQSAQQHGLPHELLTAKEIRRRFPQFTPEADTVALFEANAGVVRPEETVRANLELATRLGAELHCAEAVTAWKAAGGRVEVTTPSGNYEAGQLVIAAGPWLATVLADLALPLSGERQVQFWFEPVGDPAPFLPDRFPIWIWETKDGTHPYGLPAIDGFNGGVKVAIHHGGKNPQCTPANIDRTVGETEIADARRCVAARIPALSGRCLNAVTCLYTNTPDEHFLIDRHPAHSEVLIVSPCSGHGFKFCPVIGEITADLIAQGETRHDLRPFQLGRFQPK